MNRFLRWLRPWLGLPVTPLDVLEPEDWDWDDPYAPNEGDEK